MKLSVIVTVYNRGQTLTRCVDSLLRQDLDAYEVILVDDGSTDESRSLILEYAKANPRRIQAVLQDNGGVGKARNAGLAASTGEYITYVDSDDWVRENCFGGLWSHLQETSADILVFDAVEYFPDGSARPFPAFTGGASCGEEGELRPEEYLLARPCPWNKWIRRSLFADNDLHFPEGVLYEDLALIPCLALWAKKILYRKDTCYFYYQSAGSIMRTEEYKPAFEDIFTVTASLREALGDRFPAETEFLWWEHLLISSGRRYLDCGRKDLAARVALTMQEAYPEWRQNVYVRREPERKRLLAGLLYRRAFGRLRILRALKSDGKRNHP